MTTLVPDQGVLWGWYGTSTEDWVTSYRAAEARQGRRFDIVKRYHDFSGTGPNGLFPNDREQELGAEGRTLFCAWNSINYFGGNSDWPSIAAGDYDASVLIPVADSVKAWGRPIFIDFDHEAARLARSRGRLVDYIAAYRHIHGLFARRKVTNAIWVWVTTSGDKAEVLGSYPGDTCVDWIGWDPFNYSVYRDMRWRSPMEVFGRWYSFLQAEGLGSKPFMLAEYGCVSDEANADAQAQWYREVPAALAAHPNIKAVVAFHTDKVCDFRLATPAAWDAFGQAGRELAAGPIVNP